ncbi:hypothetical protein EYF80_023394 [Liparis tanakae]|uniref:Uncharacterized protein n=1 Tax=Liparis tanakae TaxID=230148 RepID=A0A4Z2HM51_9TELE|nr:hypothetical protein EYF80_023394 [Liparis tanakae]
MEGPHSEALEETRLFALTLRVAVGHSSFQETPSGVYVQRLETLRPGFVISTFWPCSFPTTRSSSKSHLFPTRIIGTWRHAGEQKKKKKGMNT